MANKTNIRKLIKLLESLPDEKFDMREWCNKKSCGTVACIAGWASTLMDGYEFGAEKDAEYGWDEMLIFHNEASIDPTESSDFKIWFGMTESELESLFYGKWSDKHRSEITKQEAVEHLKTLIK